VTVAKLCDAKLEGAELNSREFWFTPRSVKGGKFEAEIGTAGSIPMLLLTVLPVCVFASGTVHLHVSKGGTDVANSPTINYVKCVLLPVLEKMGIIASLTVNSYGYYPKGMGEVTVSMEPCRVLKPLVLENFGELKTIEGVSVCTFLADRKVAERQARAAGEYLHSKALKANIRVVNDTSNPLQKGSSLVLWCKSSTGAVLGADAIGGLRKPSETVGKEAAEKLCTQISSQATVDVHLADMLIPYIALAQGRSAYLTREISEHLDTNIWLTEKILNARFTVKKTGGVYRVEKTA
jgi:RNA 3'-terminal phosphate cyclase (ATP)